MNSLWHKFSWVSYPVFVVVLILFSLTFLIGGQNQAWFKLLQKQQQISKDRETVARLKDKIAMLKQVNTNQVRQDLGFMLTVIPDKRQLDSVAAELRYAAFVAGASLESYKGSPSTEGEYLLSVEYSVPDFVSMQKLLATLETSLPLLKILNTTYQAPRLSMSIAFAYAPQNSISVKFDEPLPTYQNSYAQLKTALVNYQTPVFVESVPASGSGEQSPVSTDPFGFLPGSN